MMLVALLLGCGLAAEQHVNQKLTEGVGRMTQEDAVILLGTPASRMPFRDGEVWTYERVEIRPRATMTVGTPGYTPPPTYGAIKRQLLLFFDRDGLLADWRRP